MSREESTKNGSTVATVALGALCVDPDGVRIVHVSVERRRWWKGATKILNRRTVAPPDPDAKRSWLRSGTLARR